MRTLKTASICAAAWALLAGSAHAQAPAIPDKLTLADALRLAEVRNPVLAAARARVDVAGADVVAARQRPSPVVSWLSEGYPSGVSTGRTFLDQQEMYVEVEQEIETAGRRRLRADTATHAVEAARATADDERRRLRFEVERAYFQAVLAKAESESATTTLEEIDRIIELNRTRYRLGEIAGGDLRRLEVERVRFADDLFAADLALRNARSALLALMGADRLDQPVDPTEPLAPSSSEGLVTAAAGAPADVTALGARAMENRPDLVAARREEARATSALALERALRTPNVTAALGYRRDFGQHGLVVGVSVPVPLFGRNPGGVARADAERRVAAGRVAAAETAVSLEVQQAINGVEVGRARLAYLENQYLKNAREAQQIVLAAYRAGAADLLDFLDAQRAYRESQRTYNRALYDQRITLFQLEAAIGQMPQAAAPGEGAPR